MKAFSSGLIKFNYVNPGHHGIKAEILLDENSPRDPFTLFNLFKDMSGFNHILINNKHHIINIDGKDYSDAQEW